MESTTEQATLPFAAATLTGEGQRREILQQLQAYLEDEKTQTIKDHFITMVSELIASKGQSRDASDAALGIGASTIHGDDPGYRPGEEEDSQLTRSSALKENGESGESHIAEEWHRTGSLG